MATRTPAVRPANFPHPNEVFIQNLGARLAAQRGQPTGDVAKMGKTPRDVQAGMQSLYDWARMRGDKTDEGYLVDSWTGTGPNKTPLLGPARIARTTADEVLEKRFYGDVYDEIRAAALAHGKPDRISYPWGSLEGQLQAPLYFVTHPDGSSARSVADARGVIELSPWSVSQHGSSKPRVASHELGHLVAPMPGVGTAVRPGAAGIIQKALESVPELADHRNIRLALGKRLSYLGTPPERAALAQQWRRGVYGVTGNKMTTEADRIRAVRSMLEAPPKTIPKPSKMTEGMFPEDPIMQYGPRAGQPAEGHNSLEWQLRQILPNLNPKEKREFLDILGSGASTSNPNEVVNV